MKAVAVIAARMGSTRLPGKTLADIPGSSPGTGRPLLSMLLARVRRSHVDGIIFATTLERRDNVLIEWALGEGVLCHRGSEEDVLSRIVDAADEMGAEIVVRVCGDTPLIDPGMIDLGVDLVRENVCDIAMGNNQRRFPFGISAHVCRFDDLAELNRTLTDRVAREHVTLALYEKPGKYRVHAYRGRDAWDLPGQRLQIDYPEDLAVVREIHKALGPGDGYGTGEIVRFLKSRPDIAAINAHRKEKPIR